MMERIIAISALLAVAFGMGMGVGRGCMKPDVTEKPYSFSSTTTESTGGVTIQAWCDGQALVNRRLKRIR